jgi:dTDP-4-dehydrorhamnose 3,5-epimerase-like enzyme
MDIQNFKILKDDRGSLMPIELNEVPFEAKRIFIVKDVPEGFERGNHSHFHTKQLLICLQGEIDVFLDFEAKFCRDMVTLKEGEGILINEMVWDSQVFHNEAILLVICSTSYDENDYIREYRNFRELVLNK